VVRRGGLTHARDPLVHTLTEPRLRGGPIQPAPPADLDVELGPAADSEHHHEIVELPAHSSFSDAQSMRG
jgi:hypothetical protein